jgi:hypothetical protein
MFFNRGRAKTSTWEVWRWLLLLWHWQQAHHLRQGLPEVLLLLRCKPPHARQPDQGRGPGSQQSRRLEGPLSPGLPLEQELRWSIELLPFPQAVHLAGPIAPKCH